MAEHLDRKLLHQSATVSIRDVRCRPADCGCGALEQSTTHDIVFPRRGMFVKHLGSRTVVADPTQVLFFSRAEPYRVSHPVSGGDDCTVFSFSEDVLLDAIARHEPGVRDRPETPFAVSHSPNEPRLLFLQQQLRCRLAGPPARCSIAVEEAALRLLDAVVDRCNRIRGSRPTPARPATRRSHRERAEAAKGVLAGSFHSQLALADVARAVHCSSYHLARLFRSEVGISIHQYLNRLRLAAALERLADGAPDLTELALDLGYSSHSHFTEAFRRTFATSPSSFRSTVTVGRLRQMSKNLKV